MRGTRCLTGVVSLIVISSTGCSTQQIARFEANVATSRCTDAGLAEGSPQHQQCVAAYLTAADQERATNQAVMLGIVGAAAQANAAEQQGRSVAATSSPYGTTSYRLTRSWWDAGRRMCAYSDGSVLNAGNGDCPASVNAPR